MGLPRLGVNIDHIDEDSEFLSSLEQHEDWGDDNYSEDDNDVEVIDLDDMEKNGSDD